MAEDKPWVYNTFLLDAVLKKEMKIHIFDLVPFLMRAHDVSPEERYMIFEIESRLDLLTEPKYEVIIFAVTDDPFTESAGDWVDLGYGRIRVTMKNVEKTFVENRTIFKCKRADYQLEVLQPERSLK